MESDQFLTIASESEGFFKEKGSKFLSFAFQVSTEKEIKAHLTHLKEKYYDARHHCYAFITGIEKDFYRASDAGEPKHSAGDPILNVIRSQNLTNVLIVVIRYFGGTKLGVSGLINAYQEAAADALRHNQVIVETIRDVYEINYPYELTNVVMKLIHDYQIEIKAQEFKENCSMKLAVRASLSEGVKEILNTHEKIFMRAV